MPTIVETRICKQTGKKYNVLQEELNLLEQISPVLNEKKYLIPVSQYHPDVTHQRHLARRNERTLYRSVCDLTGESMITSIHPSQRYTVYNARDYESDKRNCMDYGQDIDMNKSFSQQFGELMKNVPHPSLAIGPTMDNCDYCNYGMSSKDCYMCTSAMWSENCYFSSLPLKNYYDIDGTCNTSVQYCYECFYAMNCYRCKYAIYSNDCKYSSYLLDCKDCHLCFCCVNLNHQKYCIFNKQYTKEEYEAKIQSLHEQYTPDELYHQFHEFTIKHPRRSVRSHNTENSIGDLNFNVSNCYHCFDLQDAKDFYYCRACGIQSSDFSRVTLAGVGERIYSCMGLAEGNASMACYGTGVYQCFYCYLVRHCEYCFGCVGIQHKKYCIFNKQYSKEEYETKVAQLIEMMMKTGERGEFFNPSLSLHPYNDSDAYERFPESKEEILAKGRKWIDKDDKKFEGAIYTPFNIKEYKNNPERQKELLSGTLVCEVSGKPYRIIKQELDFYMKFDIEIPRKHPDTRYQERIQRRRLPRKLYERKCAKTGVDILTPYAHDRPEIIRSEKAWDKEFLG